MINVGDLMVGNYLECSGDFLEVICLYGDGHGGLVLRDPITKHIKQEDRSRFLRFINPIQITPEWLEKLGFELDGNKYIYRFEPDCEWDYVLFDLDWFEVKINGDYWMKAKNIESVHKLQNLIYSLTGQELTIEVGK